MNLRLPEISKILEKHEVLKKITIYFSSKTVGGSYDGYEDNYTNVNLNPVTIKVFVRDLTPTSLVWRNYGLKEQGAVEVSCDKKYLSYFENANKIEYDGDEYQVFTEGTGGRVLITKRQYNLINVVLQKV